jgi:hypothetical protein
VLFNPRGSDLAANSPVLCVAAATRGIVGSRELRRCDLRGPSRADAIRAGDDPMPGDVECQPWVAEGVTKGAAVCRDGTAESSRAKVMAFLPAVIRIMPWSTATRVT